MTRRGGKFRSRNIAVHSLRVAMFVAILVLIRAQHAGLMSRSEETGPGLAPPALEDVQRIFPSAKRLAADGDQWQVSDATGRALGTVLQTSPASDPIVGFSGSTNVLLGISAEGTLAGATILSSGDTVEHVDQVQASPTFWAQFRGLQPENYARVTAFDAVSGATLTSLAILEGVYRRLGGRPVSLRFPDPPPLETVRRQWPAAARIVAPDHPHGLWRVIDSADRLLGWILRTSPAADQIIGYQGPTDTLVFLNAERIVQSMAVGPSYDNLPYVDYVREDRYFNSLLKGRSLAELAAMDVQSAEIEGVSGATMTSVAVADGVFAAARRSLEATDRVAQPTQRASPWLDRNVGTTLVVLTGVVLAFSRWRGRRWVRLSYQAVVVGYLGLINGDFLSMALVAGWSQHGVPWRTAAGLVALSAAALLVPIFTGRNFYCHHVCPHGALQQWIRPRRRRWHVPRWADRLLRLVPAGLVALVVVVAAFPLPLSLVAIEPFNAWVFRIAGWGTITVAVVGIVASRFVPMAYCRYGCPTGALLEYLRFTSHSDRWSTRDWFALGLVGLALVIQWLR
ncbi:MAG: FMN-binding protein [Planctomycetota bacterium]|nr:MAG: FMN-binding protein [Planctomycetota bacterium]